MHVLYCILPTTILTTFFSLRKAPTLIIIYLYLMRICSKEWGPHLHIAITTYKNNWTIEMLKIAVQHLCTSPYVVMQRE